MVVLGVAEAATPVSTGGGGGGICGASDHGDASQGNPSLTVGQKIATHGHVLDPSPTSQTRSSRGFCTLCAYHTYHKAICDPDKARAKNDAPVPTGHTHAQPRTLPLALTVLSGHAAPGSPQGPACRLVTWHSNARRSSATWPHQRCLTNAVRLGSARLGAARRGAAWRGSARLGAVVCGSARHCAVRRTAQLCWARRGEARRGWARLGAVRLGWARLGSAWRGEARRRAVRRSAWLFVPVRLLRSAPLGGGSGGGGGDCIDATGGDDCGGGKGSGGEGGSGKRVAAARGGG